MTLKLRITADEYKGLDEGVRGLYEEKDGAYILPVDGIEDTSGLKSALEKERKARGDYEKAVKAYQGLGKSPEEIAALMADLKKIQDSSMSEAEKIKAENEALKAAKAAAEAEITTLKTGQLKARLLAAASLPPELADRLKGSTEDEIKADIEEVKRLFKPATVGTPSNPGAPRDESAEARGKRLAEERNKSKQPAEGVNPWDSK